MDKVSTGSLPVTVLPALQNCPHFTQLHSQTHVRMATHYLFLKFFMRIIDPAMCS